jgi:hypothetical protein
MVQASTLAVAVVALSAASTLAIPNHAAGGDFLEARGFYDDNMLAERGLFDWLKGKSSKKSSTSSASATSTSAAKGAATSSAGAHKGALPTVTRHLRAKPTECKSGEKPSWDKVNHVPIHGSRSSSQQPLAAAAPHLAARSAVAAPSGGAAAPGPTPAPVTGAATPKKVFGEKDIIGTRTTKGKDGNKTVVHVLPPTRTRCYATTSTGSATGSREEHVKKLAARAVADIVANYINQLD